MPWTLNGASIQTATVRLPRFGVWSATVAVAGPLVLAEGALVTLVVGDLTLVGTVASGGTYAEQATYQIVGGAGRWSSTVPQHTHRNSDGVTVAEVAADLCAAARERSVVVEPGAERPLGYAWPRRAGLASDALADLAGDAWWVAPDGATHIGQRPAKTAQPADVRLLSYEAALRRATVAVTDDALAQLAPGVSLILPGLPAPLLLGGVTIRVEADSIEVDLVGERPVSELLSAILTARRAASTPQLYEVTEEAQGLTSARPAGPSAAVLPDEVYIAHAPGVPGLTTQLQAGAGVLVVFLDGSTGAPRIVGYLPGVLPVKVALDATDEIRLGGATAKKLVTADEVNTALGAIGTRLNALDHAGPLLAVSGTSKVKAE